MFQSKEDWKKDNHPGRVSLKYFLIRTKKIQVFILLPLAEIKCAHFLEQNIVPSPVLILIFKLQATVHALAEQYLRIE